MYVLFNENVSSPALGSLLRCDSPAVLEEELPENKH